MFIINEDKKLIRYEPDSEITIPQDVKVIGKGVFARSRFQKVIIPEGVITIESSAFFECTSLEELTIANTVESIGTSAFTNCIS